MIIVLNSCHKLEFSSFDFLSPSHHVKKKTLIIKMLEWVSIPVNFGFTIFTVIYCHNLKFVSFGLAYTSCVVK